MSANLTARAGGKYLAESWREEIENLGVGRASAKRALFCANAREKLSGGSFLSRLLQVLPSLGLAIGGRYRYCSCHVSNAKSVLFALPQAKMRAALELSARHSWEKGYSLFSSTPQSG